MHLTKELYSHLVKNGKAVIAITGGGGKTTLLKRLSTFLRDEGLSVLITTTTKIQNPLFYDYEADHIFKDELSVLTHDVKKGEKVFYAESSGYDIKKTVSPRLELLEVLKDRYDVLLYEADGSRGLPVKIHSERDPVIIDGTTAVIAVMGLSAVGEKAYSVVFGDDSESIVDSKYISSYLKDPDGLLKGMNDSTDNVIVINQADSNADKIDEVRKVKFPYRTYIASEERDEIYLSV